MMLKSLGGFLIIYLLIGSVPSMILLVRHLGWNLRFFIISQLVTWTGGGWFIMMVIAMMKKPAGMALYTDSKPPRHPDD